METTIIIVVLIMLTLSVYKNYKQKKEITNINHDINQNTVDLNDNNNFLNTDEVLPYKKKLLLTKNEWYFYKNLKSVADELGYSVLSKIRLADLVSVDVSDKKEYYRYFGKINQKHVDFALAKPENLQIVLLIELDDNSHTQQQKERDAFVEKLYATTGYKLLRVKGQMNLKEKIQDILKEESNKEIQ